MSLDTHIRFLQPVDPRLVWEVMRRVIEAPAGYIWDRHPAHDANDPVWKYSDNAVWISNGYAMHEAGIYDTSLVAAAMYYGAEGSMLDDSEYHGEDAVVNMTTGETSPVPASHIPPPGYVDINFCNGQRDRHAELAHRLITELGVLAALRMDYEGTWTVLPPQPTLSDVQQALGFPVTA